jgi:ABC-type polysaccharide/polyol phosphate export permease
LLVASLCFYAWGMEIPYSVFVVCGLLLDQSFADATIQSVEIMTRSRGLLKRLNLSPGDS